MKTKNVIWDEMKRMQDEMDSMFRRVFRNDPFSRNSENLLEYTPSMGVTDLVESNYRLPVSDIYETGNEVVAEIEVPGIDKKDMNVTVTEDSIEVKAETHSEVKDEDKKKGIYRFERNYSGFSRYLSLPSNVDSNKAKAEYKDGVLRISVPKVKGAKSKVKQLQIK